nr:hypothetical protein [Paracandidimonas lactea]
MAALFGVFSLHWWYLGRRHAWAATLAGALMLVFSRFYPVWWDSPPFLLLIIPISAGFIESLVLALKPDEWFDARYNPGSARHNRTGWDAVLVAIFSTFVGAMVLMFGIALIVIHAYTEMGWLEGLKL